MPKGFFRQVHHFAISVSDMAVGNLSGTLFFHRQTDISGQNPCVFTCILKDGQFYDVFLMVFARYGLLASIQGFPQPSKVRQGSLKLPLGPCGLKVEAPEAQSLTWKKNSRIWTKTNCQPPHRCIARHGIKEYTPTGLRAKETFERPFPYFLES